MDLYVNCGSDYSIQDERGKKYTPDEARALWNGGKVSDCNLAFQRLATQFDFNVAALEDYYDKEQGR